MAKEPTREEDERHLLMLEARDLGMSATQIGVRFGVTRNSVLGVFKRVDDAGRCHSGVEPDHPSSHLQAPGAGGIGMKRRAVIRP